jgi:hypothetical protein
LVHEIAPINAWIEHCGELRQSARQIVAHHRRNQDLRDEPQPSRASAPVVNGARHLRNAEARNRLEMRGSRVGSPAPAEGCESSGAGRHTSGKLPTTSPAFPPTDPGDPTTRRQTQGISVLCPVHAAFNPSR